jgi:hypothetical protein
MKSSIANVRGQLHIPDEYHYLDVRRSLRGDR